MAAHLFKHNDPAAFPRLRGRGRETSAKCALYWPSKFGGVPMGRHGPPIGMKISSSSGTLASGVERQGSLSHWMS